MSGGEGCEGNEPTSTVRQVHLWDYFASRLCSVAAGKRALAKGGKLMKISVPHGAPGGVASYEHAMVTAAGVVMRITTTTVGQLEVDLGSIEILELDTSALDVTAAIPLTERREARALGAQWVFSGGRAGALCVKQGHLGRFSRWITSSDGLKRVSLKGE